ncbi:hypothetical protein PoB_002892100 [Plakobranchus ocellatus]|uniref:Uncharacterized protein n=1 Tax=Plakobranchus ocellatus TaxID=259542 RepID=A0AAV4A6X4_9GAST|nr:hypothetical protein PoB_002892100 [Plakobranchus ocellatus]
MWYDIKLENQPRKKSIIFRTELERSIYVRPSECDPFQAPCIKDEYRDPINECYWNTTCLQRCSVLGFIRGDIIVKRIELDGRETDVQTHLVRYLPPTLNPNGFRAYTKAVEWEQVVDHLKDSVDQDNVVRFECSVTDEGTGERISTLMKVHIPE